MPLILESHDSLPYVDRPSSEAELASARALLDSSLDPEAATTLHPSVPASYEPNFSPPVIAAHDQIGSSGAARSANEGIDLSRYEEPTAPSVTADTPSAQRRAEWAKALSQAYTSHSYLSARQFNLSLLERYGKNAWLIGNSQVEEELRILEQELADVKRKVEETDEDRRMRQEGIRGEIEGLEEAWRNGVGRAIEAEVAGELLRRQILEKSRSAG